MSLPVREGKRKQASSLIYCQWNQVFGYIKTNTISNFILVSFTDMQLDNICHF